VFPDILPILLNARSSINKPAARLSVGYRERVAAEGTWWIRRCWCPCTSSRPRPSASAARCADARCSPCVQCEPPTEYCRRPCDSTCSVCRHYITRTPSAERRAVPLPYSHRRQRRRGCRGRDPQYLTSRGRPVLTNPQCF